MEVSRLRHCRHRLPSIVRKTLGHEGRLHRRADGESEDEVLRCLTSLDYREIWRKINESGGARLQALAMSNDDFVSGKRTWIRQENIPLCAFIVVQVIRN
jgi:hypothetical protein